MNVNELWRCSHVPVTSEGANTCRHLILQLKVKPKTTSSSAIILASRKVREDTTENEPYSLRFSQNQPVAK